jgi:hypothetical protein
MYEHDKTGLEFIEGFALLCIAIWLGGAIIIFTLAMIGRGNI